MEGSHADVDFLKLPGRPSKPRERGVTFVIDDGHGLGHIEDALSENSDLIDLVKFGWGTGYISQNLEEKIRLYQSHDIEVFFGGTLFELSVLQGQVPEYVEMLQELGVEHVEVSTGSISLSHEEKCEYIRELSGEFTVLSELGKKDPDNILLPQEWISRGQRELDAGATKIIAEGRASGKAGVYRRDGEVRFGLIEDLLAEVSIEQLIFEAPNKEQQMWFVNEFGPNVNIGNVRLTDVIPLETLRLGLRGDTLEKFHKPTAPQQ